MVAPEHSKLYTMEEFKEFVARPENSDRLFELINGQIIEKKPGTTLYSSFGMLISYGVRLFCRDQGIICHTSGADGAYDILGHHQP